jgi:hypothetical protein
MKSETLGSPPVLPEEEPASDDALLNEEGARSVPGDGLGWLPALSVTTAVGLLVVACGFTLSRKGVSWAESLFWIGLIVMYFPVGLRLLFSDCSRAERLGLVTVLSLLLYWVKVLHSPLMFTEHDELLHLRTAIDIIQSGHLFHVNPLLPISALYPGMETVTSALTGVTHISIFQAGVLLIACARLVTMLCLFFFIEDVSGSDRVAGLGSLVYMANPNFLFFDSMFKYESMALMFVALALFVIGRTRRASGSGRYWLIGVSVLMVAATAISHHMTSYLLTVFLFVWAIAAFVRRSRESGCITLSAFALGSAALNGLWLVLVARETVGYLSPVLAGAVSAVWRLIASEVTGAPAGAGSRSLFTSTSGYVAPFWERAIAITAAGLIMCGLVLGVWQVWRSRGRIQAAGFALTIGAMAYPASLGFRLTGAGWETANRSSEFSFLPVGFVVALAIVGFWLYVRPKRFPAVTISAALTVVFLGGMIAGWTPQWRMPGPYLAMAQDTRGIDSQTLATSAWTKTYLGRHRRVGADDLNELLLGSVADQEVISQAFGGQGMQFVLISPTLTNLFTAQRKASLAYLVVDYRTILAPLTVQRYMSPAPSNFTRAQAHAYIKNKIRRDLLKFDHDSSLNRLYDSGGVVIYGLTRRHVP